MFKTTLQKVLFALGVIWIVPVTFGHIVEIMFYGRSAAHLLNLAGWLAVPVVVWHFTGVLRPIIDWFKE